EAHGTPSEWNELARPLYWGKRTAKIFATSSRVARHPVDAGTIMRFLRLRLGPDGMPVAELLRPPEPRGGGWFRCAWAAFSDLKLPKSSSGLGIGGNLAEWVVAWHGCKVEALYSIMYHGRRPASTSTRSAARSAPTSGSCRCAPMASSGPLPGRCASTARSACPCPTRTSGCSRRGACASRPSGSAVAGPRTWRLAPRWWPSGTQSWRRIRATAQR
ncbi:unnamed protein product, partial [Prorocentrum cordatum]